jgi:hypothetical protein
MLAVFKNAFACAKEMVYEGIAEALLLWDWSNCCGILWSAMLAK